MVAEELAIQRPGEKFWCGRLRGWEGESCRRSGKFLCFFLGEHVVEEDEGRLC